MSTSTWDWTDVRAVLEACLNARLRADSPRLFSWAVGPGVEGGPPRVALRATGSDAWNQDDDALQGAETLAASILAAKALAFPMPASCPAIGWTPQSGHSMLAAESLARELARR